MTLKRTVLIAGLAWMALISVLHCALNLRVFSDLKSQSESGGQEKFRIGFLPVTCHLTCPVTDFINKQQTRTGTFEPVRFNGWPELKEAFLSGYTPATFILAPLAISLREQGVPIKIVYLGHRDGTAVMVQRDSQIYRMQDLRGKRIAVPNRFSNQRLLFFRALEQAEMTIDDVEMVEMPPPDMPAALYAKAVDAVCSGEPFMAQTELDGYGRVLWLTKDVWPDFISCVLAVHEDMIRNDRATVQELVDGIARSGKWLDQGIDNRMAAAEFVSANYYNQHPRLLSIVLSKPPDRVKYSRLELARPDFEEIEVLGKRAGILQGTASVEDYADTSFVREDHLSAWDYQPLTK